MGEIFPCSIFDADIRQKCAKSSPLSSVSSLSTNSQSQLELFYFFLRYFDCAVQTKFSPFFWWETPRLFWKNFHNQEKYKNFPRLVFVKWDFLSASFISKILDQKPLLYSPPPNSDPTFVTSGFLGQIQL